MLLQMLYRYHLQPLVASLAVTCLILPLSQVRAQQQGWQHGYFVDLPPTCTARL
jgi:hypothetical protein